MIISLSFLRSYLLKVKSYVYRDTRVNRGVACPRRISQDTRIYEILT
jgi:hypothetical protein